MVFPILGGNSAGEEQYLIDNSLRFNDDDDAQLSRTPSGTSTTHTFSLWIKRANLKPSGRQTLVAMGDGSGNISWLELNNDRLAVLFNGAGSYWPKTDAVLRDVSAWYHICVVVDTTQATASDRCKFYINGVQYTDTNGTFPPQNHTVDYDGCVVGYNPSDEFDGYMAEVHFIDGTAKSPTDFGEYDDYGIWKPIEYTGGSYGTNGFYLDFENSGSLGADQSGNGNNFTPTNIANENQTTDTPTNNFATFNSVFRNNTTNFTQPATLSEGNTRATGVNTEGNISTFGLNSGKWYWEVQIKTRVSNDLNFNILSIAGGGGAVFRSVTWQSQGDLYIDDSLYDTSFTTFSSGDIIACALDLDATTPAFKLYKNGTEQGSGFTFNASGRDDNGASIFIGVGIENTSDDARINFGNPRYNIISGNSDENGYGNFEYAPPSGYLALCTQNLATALSPTIDDGSQYFNTTAYTGNASTLAITSLNFQPDFLWIKRRSSASTHALFNSTVGRDKSLGSESTDAEYTSPSDKDLISFDSNGFTVAQPNQRNVNGSGQTFVGWSWKANGGTTSSNTDGSITSTVQANTTAGFNIVTYTGNATAGATIGHGLGVIPSMFIIKGRTLSGSWVTFHQDLGATKALALQGTNAPTTSSAYFNNTAPTSSVITLGYDGAGNEVNNGGDTFVAYCFAEIEGYSKFGSYTGNGSTDGTYVSLGFRPQFIIVKRTDSTGDWHLVDNKRNGFNVDNDVLLANKSDAEFDVIQYDILSNGFKLRSTANSNNASGGTYIYMAFAENPFVTSSGVPVVAR